MKLQSPGALLSWLLLPSRCELCQRISPELICDACALLLEPVGPRYCLRCGRRRLTEWASPDCGECHGESMGVLKARSALVYNQAGRSLLAALKYKRRLGAGEALLRHAGNTPHAGWEALYGLDAPPGRLLIVPVPLHRGRGRQRRFNQAEFIARRLGQGLGGELTPGLLLRVRDTPSQVGLSANQRRVNVRGAFASNPKLAGRLGGATVVVVDDLMTTGSTLAACAVALKRGGAAAVFGLTLFSTVPRFEGAAAQWAGL